MQAVRGNWHPGAGTAKCTSRKCRQILSDHFADDGTSVGFAKGKSEGSREGARDVGGPAAWSNASTPWLLIGNSNYI